jgi:hypothetical protein
MSIFADTLYWIALINPKDVFHVKAKSYDQKEKSVSFVITDELLIELLTYFSSYGSKIRLKMGQWVQGLLVRPDVKVISQNHDSFIAGLELYQNRLDKERSNFPFSKSKKNYFAMSK